MSYIAWMCGSLLSFSLLAVGARELSGDLSTFQVLFFRSVIGLSLVAGIMHWRQRSELLTTHQRPLHVFRNIFHYGGQYGWFVGIGLLPLAEVFALEFTVPLWTTIIAACWLNEPLTVRKVLAVLLGMLGVVIIVQPGLAIIDTASLIVLAAAICYAVSHSSTKALARTEHPITVIYYMCLVQLPMGFLLSVWDWRWPSLSQWLWIFVIGVAALSAHFCLTQAMRHAELGKVMTFDFLRLPLIGLVGILLYQETLEWPIVVGGAVMLFANWINFKGRTAAT